MSGGSMAGEPQPTQMSLLRLTEIAIPSIWRCRECRYTDYENRFKTRQGHRCPKCSVDNNREVFPTRWFKCKKCGREADQEAFFGTSLPIEGDSTVRDFLSEAICPNISCEPTGEIFVEVTEIPVPGFGQTPATLGRANRPRRTAPTPAATST